MPLGLIYAGSAAERCGHKAVIVDPYLGDIELKRFDAGNFNRIIDAIERYNPSVIGYGGIATSYSRAKRLSLYIKERYPHILQIAGGPLASVYKPLLANTGVSVVFHGETEVSLPAFLKKLEDGGSFHGVPGISYLKEGEFVTTPPPEQINDLDTIPIPSLELVDVNDYMLDVDGWVKGCDGLRKYRQHYNDVVKKVKKTRRCLPMVTSRGCTHRCSFCYRHYSGIRQHSVDYVMKFIGHLKDKYGIDSLQFGDELFNSNTQWVLDFCDAMERHNPDLIYRIVGARVDKVSEKMLIRLKETGCAAIDYGQESGSDIILKEYGKGTTMAQNKDVFILTTKTVGIPSTVQIVIGSPSETNATISETVKFLKELSAYPYSLNYLIPLPGTPIWRQVEARGLVKDVEAYLDLVAERGGAPLVNLTKEPDHVWRRWSEYIRNHMKSYYYKGANPLYYHAYNAFYKITSFIRPFIPSGLKSFIPGWLKNLY